jgi:hypothetical protein
MPNGDRSTSLIGTWSYLESQECLAVWSHECVIELGGSADPAYE